MSAQQFKSLALINSDAYGLNTGQKLALSSGLLGLLLLVLATFGVQLVNASTHSGLAIFLLGAGIVYFARVSYRNKISGIQNGGVMFRSLTSRGVVGWLLGISLTVFYVILYFYPAWLGLGKNGGPNSGLIALFDPFSLWLNGNAATQWFVYGALYTFAIIVFGYKFLLKYRHNPYQKLRTISVMFFQFGFAFLIPELMSKLNSDTFKLPYYDLKSIWPLNYYNFDKYRVNSFIDAGDVGLALLIFGVVSIFIITPLLTYKYGKRWYCSWVCGCGGLAETVGDPFRQLSDKSISAWKIERWVIHSVVVFAVLMTTAVIYSYLGHDRTYWLTKSDFLLGVGSLLTIVMGLVFVFKRKELGKDAIYGAVGYFFIILTLIALFVFDQTDNLFFFKSTELRRTYGFLIGSVFSGVIGTGFYPIFGSRVWCRFGCPMAAILGFQQRLFSRFRITTNGGQCISCGNCSTYCEMGIDVRSYAQKGENIVRSSCVGCGVCSAVCPRGVLKLENDHQKGRINPTQVLLGNDVDLMDLMNQR